MALRGVKPNADRSQVRHRNPVADWTEVENVPYEGGPALPPRARADAIAWAEAGVIPGDDWPPATVHWWGVISTMPHAKLWQPGDWEFAAMTAEIHARVAEGWKGYTGPELRQREKLLGVYADARRDLRIKYVEPKPTTEVSADVARLDDYRGL
jgi:hypothetical protein